MFRLINISGDELRLDDKGVSGMVTHACNRSGIYVEGFAVRQDSVTLICSSKIRNGDLAYRFTFLGQDVINEAVFAEIRTRYDHDFRTVAVFQLPGGWWTLTEKLNN
ncbi:MAG: hypothetical protein IKD10_01455 [Lentisphaeria bacterium]|nr:hypothetical protein [Lentisphaeria bacterium]